MAGGSGLVQEWQAGERFGWRVMVRLGAVLCGSVMYGFVWQARRGQFWIGGVLRGRVWFAMAGYKKEANNLWSTNGKMRHG